MALSARSILLLSTVGRLRALKSEAVAKGLNAAYPSSHQASQQTAGRRTGYWAGFPIEFLFWAAPLVCAFVLFTQFWIGRGLPRYGIVLPENFVPWLLVALGVTWAARIGFRYQGDFQPAQVNHLMKDLSVSQMRPRAVEIEGEIVGKAQPGSRWSTDLMLQDETGSMLLFYRSSLPFGRLFFAFHSVDRLIGERVKVQGWYRRGLHPYIEIARIQAYVSKPTAELGGTITLFSSQGEQREIGPKRPEKELLVERSYSRWIQLQLSAACAAAGIVWLLGMF